LVFRDQTEQRELQEAAQRAQRLESLGVLAGGLAHDFNNLLTGLFGYVELAFSAADRPEKVREFLKSAASVLGRARGLTQQLLTFSKGGTPVRSYVDLHTVLRDTTRFALSGAAVSADFDLPPDLDVVYVDPNQLAQVVDNLLINAKQAMPMGGRIQVRARNVAQGAPLPGELRPGRYVCISLKDQGTGIPRDHLARIFDPFFTTKQQGSGLGLASAHSIVHRHDGAIEVESELGKGSTFHVWLPSQAQAKATPAVMAARQQFGGRTVLVLDDEDYIRDVSGEMLHALGCEVLSVRNGADAVIACQHAAAQGKRIDLFLLDLTIPGGMGGQRTLDELRALDPTVAAIASSGYSEDPIIAAPRDFGFAASIRKPFVLEELAAAIGIALQPSDPVPQSADPR